MLALTSGKRASNQVITKIARAFTKQTFPLTEEGESLKREVISVLEREDIAWLRRNMPQLPIVENPHPELFSELDFGHLGESEVMGHKLSVIQTHQGCYHNCVGFCSAGATGRITSKMPFMAYVKLARCKFRYDRRYAHICKNWYHHMHKMGLVPKNESALEKKIKSMKTVGEFLDFIIQVTRLSDIHPIADHLRLWQVNDEMEIADIPWWFVFKEHKRFLPVFFHSLQMEILTFRDNDPVHYYDPFFLSEDGSPADFGDAFRMVDTYVRPVFVSTSGWNSADIIAEQATRKVVDAMKGDKSSAGLRLSIKRYVSLCRTDPVEYLSNLKRILKVLWPLVETDILQLAFFHDPRIKGDKHWAEEIRKEIDDYAKREFGQSIAGFSKYSAVSRRRGLAYDPQYSEEDWDPDDKWGYEIRPDGSVTWRDESVLVGKETRGKIDYRFESPMAEPIITGVKLW